MVSITQGVTFQDSGAGTYATLTATELFNLVANASASGYDWTEITHLDAPFHVSASIPAAGVSACEGTLWYDTANDLVRARRFSARWDPDYRYLHCRNDSGATIRKGAVCKHGAISNGVPSVLEVDTEDYPEILGVALATMTDGSEGFLVRHGWAEVNIATPVTAGNLLAGSTTSGQARVFDGNATFGVAFGQYLDNISASGNTLVTCRIF